MLNDSSKILTRKEREREFKRQEILSAALNLFAQKGFEHTTLDEIAETAEFGKGTLYNYFQNKEDIFTALLEKIFNDFIGFLRQVDAQTETLHDFLYKLSKTMFEYWIQNDSVLLLLLNMRMKKRESIKHLFSERMLEIHKEGDVIHRNKVKTAIKNNEIINEDPDKVAMAYRGLLFSYVFSLMNCEKIKNFDAEKEAKFLVDLFMNGLKKRN